MKQSSLLQTAPAEGATIETQVGNTPLLQFPLLTAHLPVGVSVLGKAEWFNPGGSVKDRPALNIIRRAEERGDLRPGMTLLDSTSGNMGIAYAMFGNAYGYRVKLVVPANASPERMAILRAYGVELELSDPLEGSDGAIRRVREIYAQSPEKYFYADQYNNLDNWLAHYHSTGIEIWEQTEGTVTHLIAGLGTSGTLTGTGKRLKEYNAEIQLVAFQPDSPFHGLEGLKHMPTAIVPGIYDPAFPDVNIQVRTEDAHAMCRRLAREEGVLVGISSGAAMAATLQIAETLTQATLVTILPDSAAKYLSESFWIEEETDRED